MTQKGGNTCLLILIVKIVGNKPKYKYIDLSTQADRKIFMQFGASAGTNTLGEWRISIDPSLAVKVRISRDVESKEDINLYLLDSLISGYIYTNKGLTNGETTKYTIEKSGIELLRLRSKLYDTSSRFQVSVVEYQKSKLSFLVNILLILGLACIFLCTICAGGGIVGTHGRIKYQQRLEDINRRNRIRNMIENRYIRVTHVMNKQINDEFKNIHTRYVQENCVVCLEDFTPNSQVHVTNEGSHVFHTSGLKEWYDNTDPSKDLTGPHGNTINTMNSSPEEISNRVDEKSIDVNLNHEENKLGSSHIDNSQNLMMNTNRPTYNIDLIREDITSFRAERNIVQNS